MLTEEMHRMKSMRQITFTRFGHLSVFHVEIIDDGVDRSWRYVRIQGLSSSFDVSKFLQISPSPISIPSFVESVAPSAHRHAPASLRLKF
jgi:hypothetical protein